MTNLILLPLSPLCLLPLFIFNELPLLFTFTFSFPNYLLLKSIYIYKCYKLIYFFLIMKVFALVSGGKDSIFNIHKCIQNGHQIVALGNLYNLDEVMKCEAI